HRVTFRTMLDKVAEGVLSEGQRAEVAEIAREEEAINTLITRSRPTPELSMRLQKEFALLFDRAQSLVRAGDEVIDEEIEKLRTEAVRSRNNVFWLVIALIPTAVLLIGAFTFLISRPITQVSRGIRGLGDGEFAKAIRVDGPADMVRLGEQLDWLRGRLVTLEAQKTRFLQHMSHELKT